MIKGVCFGFDLLPNTSPVYEMEALSALQEKKDHLDVQDACLIMQLLQDQTGPLLSLRASTTSTVNSKHAAASGQDQGRPEGLVTRSNSLQKHSHKDQVGTKVVADLNVASLDEFPPVSVLMHEKR